MYQNCCKKCDSISLHIDESREFECAQSQNKGAVFQHLNKEDVIFSHEERLYPADVLEALAKHGIINFVREK